MLNQQNNNKKNEEKRLAPTVYSKYAFANTNAQLEKSKLTFTYLLNGLLKISIAPFLNDKGDFVEWDYKNEGSIYLTHTKARLLYNSIVEFINGKISSVGVNTTSGIIYICDGKEFDVDGIFLVIRAVDENGKSNAGFVYEFNKNYHYAIENYNANDGSFAQCYYDELEINMLMDTLKDYYTSMNGALAYSFMEYNRFNDASIRSSLYDIANALGIEKSNQQKQNVSYFDKQRNQQHQSNEPKGVRKTSLKDFDEEDL